MAEYTLALRYSDHGYEVREKGKQTWVEWRVSTFFHRYKDAKNTFEKASSDHLCAFLSQITTLLMNLQRNLVSKYLFLTCIVKMVGKKKGCEVSAWEYIQTKSKVLFKIYSRSSLLFSYFFSISNEGLTSKVKLSLLMRHC